MHCHVGKLLKGENLPEEEENFQKVYVKAPSFLSIHMGVKADVLPSDTDCHHFVLEVFFFLLASLLHTLSHAELRSTNFLSCFACNG